MHTLEMPTNSLGKLGITKTSQLEKRDQGLRTQLVFHGMEICTSGSRLLVFYCRQLNKTVEKEIEVATLTLEFFPQPTMLCINGSSSVFVGCPGTGRRDLSEVTAAGGLQVSQDPGCFLPSGTEHLQTISPLSVFFLPNFLVVHTLGFSTR